MMDALDGIAEDLTQLDWGDIDGVESGCRVALEELATNGAIIGDRLKDLGNRPELLRLCEHYDILDKIVLFADEESGVRIRLHVFLPGYFDRPHNHRWSYASYILRGRYRHHLFGNAEVDEKIDPNTLAALQVRQEHVGTSYALHHSMVHAVVAEPYAVSLVIRGPAVKDRFLVMDRQTGESWWQYGAEQEPVEEAMRKSMSFTRLFQLTSQLQEWKVF